MSAKDRPEEDPDPATPPLTLKGSFGTALGASMLGLEQALRDGPPPQVEAAEHEPDRRTIPGGADLEIHFPAARRGPDEEA